MSRGPASGGKGDPEIAAGPKLLSVARVVTSRTRGGVQNGGAACRFSCWRAPTRPPAPLSDCVRMHKPRHGQSGRAALKGLTEGWSQGTMRKAALGRGLEGEAQLGGGYSAAAHAPPVDEKP